MQISRIFGAETTILRAFQTFLRPVLSLEKLRSPKEKFDNMRFIMERFTLSYPEMALFLSYLA